MKITKNEINCTNVEDENFQKKLQQILKDWYNLGLKDMIKVMELLGVTEDEYEILYLCDGNDYLKFKIVIPKDNFIVELFRGNMTSPYPLLKIYNEGSEPDIFSVEKDIKVEKISLDAENLNEQ